MMEPLISVVITTYNREEFLLEAISSAANQTYRTIEILVVDDGSDHNYAEAICANFKTCKYFYKENGGLSSARNYGVQKAKGSYIAFLDDDDFWKNDKLEKQILILESNQDVDLVHSSAKVVDGNGAETGKVIGASPRKVQKRSGYVFWNALGTWVVKSPTPLIRKTVFKPDLLFDETISVGEDLDFYQRLFYRHRVYYISEPLAYYRDVDTNNRLSKKKQEYIGIEKKVLLNLKKMGVTNPIILHRVAQKLSIQALRNWNAAFPGAQKEMNWIKYYLTPIKYINSAFDTRNK